MSKAVKRVKQAKFTNNFKFRLINQLIKDNIFLKLIRVQEKQKKMSINIYKFLRLNTGRKDANNLSNS